MDSLQKRYGLMTAIGMVVGIVIGSGIFFKAKDVLRAADGNALFSVLSWVISGFIMVVIATTFAVMATKYEKVNGIVDYAEAACGKTYAYFIGWFMSLIYYPAMTSVLAWVSARYTLVIAGYIDAPLFAIDSLKSAINSPECITLAAFYLILGFFVNSLAPAIAGKFQISSTVVKLVPVLGIALVGTVIGLVNGTLVSNFDPTKVDASAIIDKPETTGLFPAICSTIFAYEGWIVATTINSEIRDSKRNLPIALCVGTLITDEVQELAPLYMALHDELGGYLRELSEVACDTGKPMVRHMILEYQNDPNVADVDDQYMYGDALLVAPILTCNTKLWGGETVLDYASVATRTVYLPAGEWIDLNTGKTIVSTGQTITVEANLAKIPVYLNTASEYADELQAVFAGETWSAIKALANQK